MEDPNNTDIISPEAELRASKAGLLPGIALVAWAVVFSLFRSDMSPIVYWCVFVCVALLIVLVPSWIVGQRAKREYLERQRPDGSNVEDQSILSLVSQVRGSWASFLPGIVLVVWVVVISLFRSDMAPVIFWSVFVSVALLIVLVPSWIVGQRAKRDYLVRKSHRPPPATS